MYTYILFTSKSLVDYFTVENYLVTYRCHKYFLFWEPLDVHILVCSMSELQNEINKQLCGLYIWKRRQNTLHPFFTQTPTPSLWGFRSMIITLQHNEECTPLLCDLLRSFIMRGLVWDAILHS